MQPSERFLIHKAENFRAYEFLAVQWDPEGEPLEIAVTFAKTGTLRASLR